MNSHNDTCSNVGCGDPTHGDVRAMPEGFELVKGVVGEWFERWDTTKPKPGISFVVEEEEWRPAATPMRIIKKVRLT